MEVNMSELNSLGPHGQGPMTGRRMGWCSPYHKGETDSEIWSTRSSLLAALLISAAKLAWTWIKEKRLKKC